MNNSGPIKSIVTTAGNYWKRFINSFKHRQRDSELKLSLHELGEKLDLIDSQLKKLIGQTLKQTDRQAETTVQIKLNLDKLSKAIVSTKEQINVLKKDVDKYSSSITQLNRLEYQLKAQTGEIAELKRDINQQQKSNHDWLNLNKRIAGKLQKLDENLINFHRIHSVHKDSVQAWQLKNDERLSRHEKVFSRTNYYITLVVPIALLVAALIFLLNYESNNRIMESQDVISLRLEKIETTVGTQKTTIKSRELIIDEMRGIYENIKELTRQSNISPEQTIEINRVMEMLSGVKSEITALKELLRERISAESMLIIKNRRAIKAQKRDIFKANHPPGRNGESKPGGSRVLPTKDPQKKKYTIQLIGAYRKQSITNIQNRFDISDNTSVLETQREGRAWYILLQGRYDSRQQAQKALQSLPIKLQATGAWVRVIP